MRSEPKPKVLVCGGRNMRDRAAVSVRLDALDPCCVIHGGAPGADTLAGDWARDNGVCEVVVTANWKAYGNPAGPIRNKWMLDYCTPDLVVAFPGGRGTASMVSLARRAGVTVLDLRAEAADAE